MRRKKGGGGGGGGGKATYMGIRERASPKPSPGGLGLYCIVCIRAQELGEIFSALSLVS